MAKIWLINIPENSKKNRHLPNNGIYPNLGIHAIFSFLKEKGIDIEYNNVIDGEVVLLEEIEEKISLISNGDIVGFHISISNYNETKEVSQIIKIKSRDTKIIYGGPLATTKPYAILQNNQYVDAVIAGDGEQIFYNIAKIGFENVHQDGIIKRENHMNMPSRLISCINNIEYMPSPLKHVSTLEVYLNNYRITSGDTVLRPTTSYFHKTGCEQNCPFCTVPYIGRIGRSKRPETAWEETLMLHHQFGINHIYEVSDNILFSKNNQYDWFKRFAQLAPKYIPNEEVSFRFYASTNRINKELMHYIKLANCNTLSVGFESNDDNVLSNAKSFHTSSHQNLEVFNLIKAHNLKLVAFFILGLPFENSKSIKKTYEFIKKVADYKNTTFILAALLSPLPKTAYWTKYVMTNSYLRNKYDLSDNGNLIEPTWSIENIAKDFNIHCSEVSVEYNKIKEYQKKIYALRPEVFSSWAPEDF
ncbi:MAG: radical SAM protein [Bacteroidales bacterium]|nr:radical SAM protein [Bacteroidales bacterium]